MFEAHQFLKWRVRVRVRVGVRVRIRVGVGVRRHAGLHVRDPPVPGVHGWG